MQPPLDVLKNSFSEKCRKMFLKNTCHGIPVATLNKKVALLCKFFPVNFTERFRTAL